MKISKKDELIGTCWKKGGWELEKNQNKNNHQA